nr:MULTISPECIES: ABC transporter substrate-binding protein [unclassified Fusibacter]
MWYVDEKLDRAKNYYYDFAELDEELRLIQSEPVLPIDGEAVMQNTSARKAIALAIDKEFITADILGNGSIAVDYFVPKGLVYDNKRDFRAVYFAGWLHYNPKLASDYWEKAKEELGFTNVRLVFKTYDSESSKKISEHIKSNLEAALSGLEVELKQMPFKSYGRDNDEGPIHMEFAGWGPDYPDAMTFLDMWVTGGGHNTSGYSDELYDQTIESAKFGELTKDTVKRTQTLQELERKLIEEDAVIVPLYQRGGMELVKPYVHGIQTHAFGADHTYKRAVTKEDEDGKRILNLVTGHDIPSMDTNKATNDVSFEVMGNVLEGLFTFGEYDELEYGLAKSYHKSEDGLTYVFDLRENARWSNGAQVTANDFVYSWRRLADPKTGSQYQFMVETAALKNFEGVMKGTLETSELGVVALDDYTLEVTLEHPIPYFEKLMTFPNFYPVNQAFVEAVGDDFGTSMETTLYNGPFVLTEWNMAKGYAISKNENYWDSDHVSLDGVTFKQITDAEEGVKLYKEGEIDKTGLSSELINEYRDHPELKQRLRTAVFYLILNQ